MTSQRFETCARCGGAADWGRGADAICRSCHRDTCPRCGKPGAREHYDRHGIYSGRACEKCADKLPGQGAMRNYEMERGEEGDE